MKGGETVDSVYLRKPDPDYFRLWKVEQHKPRERIKISGKVLLRAWRESLLSGMGGATFLTGWMVLHEAEPGMRKMYRKISAKGARGITTNVKSCQYYLLSLVKKLHTPIGKNADEMTDEEKKKSVKRRKKADKKKGCIVMKKLNEVLEPLKQKYHSSPPPRDYYPLTIGALHDLDISTEAQVFMMSQLTSGRIDGKRYQLIQQEVKRLFPADAPAVIDALTTSKTLEVFAVIAIPEVNGVSTVAIANDHGDWVRIESFKFCKLIESPDTALVLGTINKHQGAVEQPLAYGSKTHGLVIGKMLSQTQRLMIKIMDTNTDACQSTVEFSLDIDYAVLLVAVLQHIRQDYEQHQRWKENALSIPARDPFANN